MSTIYNVTANDREFLLAAIENHLEVLSDQIWDNASIVKDKDAFDKCLQSFADAIALQVKVENAIS